jgi:endonuclease III
MENLAETASMAQLVHLQGNGYKMANVLINLH